MGILNTAHTPLVSGLPWNGVRYFCTTRRGGVSAGPWSSFNLGGHVDDNSALVEANRQRLRALLPAEPLWLNQVHGTQVVDADLTNGGSQDAEPPLGDAALTSRAHRVLAIMTADCLPVVLAAAAGGVLAVAHAGWRGLAAGVLENTMLAMRARAPDETSWRAWIGPAISQRYFEVGDDVRDAFTSHDPHTTIFFVRKQKASKWLADLPSLARHRLHKIGVENIELSGQCTFGQAEDYYSYRREPVTGRMVTLAWLEGESRGSDLP